MSPMRFLAFGEIRDRLVGDDNPARDGGDMDYERCAALHNAIVKHGWTASGRSLDDLPLTTCWEANEEDWEADASRLHPSMVEFLKRAYNTELPETEPIYNCVSREYKFFYFLEGLIGPQGHEVYDLGDHIGDHPGHYMTLYSPNNRLGSHAQGLMLETILSVYIDMIETEKVVCIHNDVEKPGDFKLVNLGEEAGQQWLSTQDRPDSLVADPITGLAKNGNIMFGPWIVLQYTKGVLEQCLETWEVLVEAIEQKIPAISDSVVEVQYGLADESMLETAGIIEDFLRKLLLRARRPRFTYIAPGIRLPTPEEFIDQPFSSIKESEADEDIHRKMPFLIFRGENTCRASEHFSHPYNQASRIPTGLYLEGWTQSDLTPFTDATRLLLPFAIGGEDTWAQTSNGLAIDGRHDELYQIGDNPFAPDHGTSLLGILQNFYAHVVQGNWSVDGRGVSDPIDKFREAETEEHCNQYAVPMGPGEFW
ncbi:unnamed protein product [Aureobasidium vineae]|uniref:Uncharacterized protein n=1 Tax=Aureobasidium vineae TaxID=2773715 RepID=A0A9N8JXT7_9PEZI|nr:unnamed protein product [Aureobasidium vineae]